MRFSQMKTWAAVAHTMKAKDQQRKKLAGEQQTSPDSMHGSEASPSASTRGPLASFKPVAQSPQSKRKEKEKERE